MTIHDEAQLGSTHLFPGNFEIPNKSTFKQDEVCGLLGVKPYVLRFWESEFQEIAPTLSSTGQKIYEYRDVEMIALIKKLLFEDKLSVERARAELQSLVSLDANGADELQSTGPFRASDIEKLEAAKLLLKEIVQFKRH